MKKNMLRMVLIAVAGALVLLNACSEDEGPTLAQSVQVDGPSNELDEGATLSLTATIIPLEADQTVSWSSGSTSVATVSAAGLVTGVSPGNATITATAQDGSGVSGTFAVTVIAVDREAPVITLAGPDGTTYADGATINVIAGDGFAITATAQDDLDGDISSSIVVTGNYDNSMRGSYDLTYSVTDSADKETSVSITIVVMQQVTAISISGAQDIFVAETVTLTATATPDDANDKTVSWSSSDNAIATIDENGTVTGVGGGQVTITATANDGSGITGTTQLTVKVPVASIALNDESERIVGLDSTIDFDATVSPSNADDQTVTWVSTNTNVATVDANGVVTGVGDGTTTIYAEANDGSEVRSAEVTINFLTETFLAIRNIWLNQTPDYTFTPGVNTVQGSGDDTQSQIWIGTFNATTDFSTSPQTILDIGDDPSNTSLFSGFFIGLMGGDLAYANTGVGNSGSNRRSFANDLNTNTDYTYVIEMDATDQVWRAYVFEASDPSLVFQSDMRNTLSSQSRSPRTGLVDGVTIAYEVLDGDVYVEPGNGVVPGEFLGGSTSLRVYRETTLPDN